MSVDVGSQKYQPSGISTNVVFGGVWHMLCNHMLSTDGQCWLYPYLVAKQSDGCVNTFRLLGFHAI